MYVSFSKARVHGYQPMLEQSTRIVCETATCFWFGTAVWAEKGVGPSKGAQGVVATVNVWQGVTIFHN
jgi:hypothetical protein